MYEDRILREFPHEFQGKAHISALVRAFARQLNELLRVIEDLNQLRAVDTAQGKQLDGVGDIAVLTRSDAMRLIQGSITYDIMDDEHYRHYLKYKILKNTSTCNYYDIVTAVRMLWGVDEIEYFENPSEPATMTLTFSDPGGNVQLDDIPPIRAAGVGMHIRAASTIRISQPLYGGSCVGVCERQQIMPASFRRIVHQQLCTGMHSTVFEQVSLGVQNSLRRHTNRISINMGLLTVTREQIKTDLRLSRHNQCVSQVLGSTTHTAVYDQITIDLKRRSP